MNFDKQWQAAYMDATASGLGQQHKNIVSYMQMFENQKTGLCYPSVKTLARMVGCSERTLQRGIRFLEQKEILEAVGTKTGGKGHTTPYRIHPEKWISDKPLKGDIAVTPFDLGKGDKTGPERVTNSSERVTKTPLKGDTQMSPEECKSIRESKSAPTPTGKRMEGAIQFLWKTYLDLVDPGPYSLTAKRREMISARLLEFISQGMSLGAAVNERLNHALIAFADDDYHMGRKKNPTNKNGECYPARKGIVHVFGTQETCEDWLVRYEDLAEVN